jgi:hypothetical protein
VFAACGPTLPGSPSTAVTASAPPPPGGSPSASPSASPIRPTGAGPADPVPVEVVEAGFTPITTGGLDLASFAVVLRNPNDDLAVRRLLVHVDAFDPAGAFIGGEELFVSLLPNQTAAIGGELHGGGATDRLDVVPQEDLSAFTPAVPAADSLELAGIETVTSDETRTSGTIENPGATPLSAILLTAVYRDAGGAIIGGAGGGVDRVGPGDRVEFEIIGVAVPGIVSTDVSWTLDR